MIPFSLHSHVHDHVNKGISIWAPKLQEGEEYISDEHGVRLSFPDPQRGGAQQFPAGPILLERTAEVVECGEGAFFITSIVHCFPSGANFAEPLLLEFAFEVKDGTADVRGAYQVNRLNTSVGSG